ncbi:MAG: aminotransferase class III-fold pyridoxal phosphate-dependent enzyme [Ardenticatenaceae bacterium]|nr:aminotransferase class III-fold pyridoxal phosphate-dependent enzyme [Ardenticatenaceae bacterium]
MSLLQYRPQLTLGEAEQLAQTHYNLTTTATTLPSERDQNILLQTTTGNKFVLKISNATEKRPMAEMENAAMSHLAQHGLICPEPVPTVSGETLTTIHHNNQTHFMRLITHLPGEVLAKVAKTPELLAEIGRFLAHLTNVLHTFDHPAAHRDFHWDMQHAPKIIRQYLPLIPDEGHRALVEHFLIQFEHEVRPNLPQFRRSTLYNDANDYNLLVQNGRLALLDFGDMVHSYTAFDLAIGMAYTLISGLWLVSDRATSDLLLEAATAILQPYHQISPLTAVELYHLPTLIPIRWCTSVAIAAHQMAQEPDNDYLAISQKGAWAALKAWHSLDPAAIRAAFQQAIQSERSQAELHQLRQHHLGPSLSLSYNQPLKIVRGSDVYLYDEAGRPFLDLVNNVCHVGHCHPRVVQALCEQAAVLNTNTRYLHDNIVTLAQKLTATLPRPLSVCFFVNSGSEANDLALRLARTHTGQQDTLVLDAAYHGNLTSLIEISPYKHDGRGGQGAPPHVHKLLMPDPYRGPYKGYSQATGQHYAQHIQETIHHIQKQGRGLAAFIAESVLGCGGQIVLPDGYLQAAFNYVRQAGGVCIADEVQVGFGRVGTHFWGFQTQEVVPDIVTMGKPFGNGHPLAAVVTTPEIAASFNNGMEYFNTFGGNPVSCAVGTAVLDIIRDQDLQQNALHVGNYLMDGLRQLQSHHPLIGDVRGLGLFIGIELVRDPDTLEPAAAEASHIVNQMKERGILLSTDGPLHNVIKIKPPITLTTTHADFVLAELGAALSEMP